MRRVILSRYKVESRDYSWLLSTPVLVRTIHPQPSHARYGWDAHDQLWADCAHCSSLQGLYGFGSSLMAEPIANREWL